MGATNFRAGSQELGVYGVAQPTYSGLCSVLSLLRSAPTLTAAGEIQRGGRETVWFCTREEPVIYLGECPFVLRERGRELETYEVGLSGVKGGEGLEGVEMRCVGSLALWVW